MGMIADKSSVLRALTYERYPDAADLDPAGDFTLEFFNVNFSATAGTQIFWNHYNATGNQRSLRLSYTSGTGWQAVLSLNGTATTVLTYSTTPTTSTNYQIAVDRSSNSVRLYVDGVVRAGPTTVTGALFNTTDTLTIGADSAGANAPTATWAAVRYTVGVARYAGAYTPPSLPLPTT